MYDVIYKEKPVLSFKEVPQGSVLGPFIFSICTVLPYFMYFKGDYNDVHIFSNLEHLIALQKITLISEMLDI